VTRTARRQGLTAAATGLVALLAAVAILQALVEAGLINRFIVPPPSEVAASFGRIVVEENVPARLLLTAGETFAAAVLLTAAGISLGALLYRFPLLRRACETWVAALASAPIVLMYPLFLVMFGRSARTIVAIGFVAALPPVILKTLEGLAGTRRVLIDVGRSFKLTPAQQFFKILFPAALPSMFVGVRLGLIFALINIVGVEFLINFGGLGQLIGELADRYDVPGTYAAICFVILVSVAFFAATGWIERWLRPAD
jgi:NitT/TauT family transport system permease protein